MWATRAKRVLALAIAVILANQVRTKGYGVQDAKALLRASLQHLVDRILYLFNLAKASLT